MVNSQQTPQYIINRQAIVKAEETYPKLHEAYDKSPGEVISYLRVLGLKCSVCAKGVTGPNLKFFGFNADVRCYNCQNLHA